MAWLHHQSTTTYGAGLVNAGNILMATPDTIAMLLDSRTLTIAGKPIADNSEVLAGSIFMREHDACIPPPVPLVAGCVTISPPTLLLCMRSGTCFDEAAGPGDV